MHLNAASEPQSLLSLSPIPPAQNFPWFWTALIAWSSASLVTSTHKRICIPKGAPLLPDGLCMHRMHAHTTLAIPGTEPATVCNGALTFANKSIQCYVVFHLIIRPGSSVCASVRHACWGSPRATLGSGASLFKPLRGNCHTVFQVISSASQQLTLERGRPRLVRGPVSPSSPQRCCYMIHIAS